MKTKTFLILFIVWLIQGPPAWAQTPSIISFSTNAYFVSEGNTNGVYIRVWRLGDTNRFGSTNGSVSVHYATSDGTATAGRDYIATSGTITFAPGQWDSGFFVPIIYDDITESTETVYLTLSDPTGGAELADYPGGSTNVLYIYDALPAPVYLQFGSYNYTVSEADGAVAVTVVRQGPTSRAMTVRFATSDGTAKAGPDYVATNGTLTFGLGEATKTIVVPVRNDGLAEDTEYFNLALSDPAGSGVTLGSPSTTQIYIADTGAGLHFSQPSFTVTENGGAAMITVTLAGEFTNVVTVDYATSDGTATAGQDYTATNGTLTFLPGQGGQTISVPILNDSLVEGTEAVNLTLSNPTGGAILGAPSNAVLYINDNDFLSLDSPSDVNENDGTVTVSVRRIGDMNGPTTLNYFTSDGDANCSGCRAAARAGVDYLPEASAFTFASGEANKAFTIPILDNARVDGDRVFTVSLIYGSSLLGQAQITIHDNEIPAVIDFSFNPGNGVTSQFFGIGQVLALAVQADGKILIGGSFDTVEDVGRTNIARLNPDGSLDTNFVASTSLTDQSGNAAQVTSLALQTNGQILIGGNFTTINDMAHSGLASLNPDGSLNTNFNASITLTNQVADQNGSSVSATLKAVAVQADGKIIVGGTFDTVNGVSRTNLARLEADGSLDTNFSARMELTYSLVYPWDPFNLIQVAASVSALALQPDGNMIVGGEFMSINGVERTSIARLNQNGSLDGGFFVGDGVENGDYPGIVRSIFWRPDGTTVIGGQFTAVHGIGRNSLARINSDGTLDASFSPAQNRRVDAVAVEATDYVLVAESSCGWGCSFAVKRLNPDGSLDDTFPRVSGGGRVGVVAIVPDGDVIIGGSFQYINVNNGGEQVYRPGIARLYGNPNQARVQFADPYTGFYSTDLAVAENGGPATLTAQRLGDTSNALTVDYATSDGTAKAGLNYVATNGTLRLAPLEISKTITVAILRDGLATGPVTFSVTMRNPSAGTLFGGLNRATMTIQDSDMGFFPRSITRQADGQVSLALNLPVLGTYVLQTSTNLVDWSPLRTYTTSGYQPFTDTDARKFSHRFYRVLKTGP